MFIVLLLAVGALGYGVAAATGQLGDDRASAASSPHLAPTTSTPSGTPAGTPSVAPPGADPTTQAPGTPASPSSPATQVDPPPAPVLRAGDHGTAVRALQSRLRQLAWFSGDVTDTYGPRTTEAVKGFQAKRGLPATGLVDARTLRRLERMTHTPTADELANRLDPAHGGDGSWTGARLDPRCTTGRALCIDKTSRTIRWVVDGTVEKTMAVRFGASYAPTREGLFHVESKSRDHVSSLYGSAMPFAMFFSRGQAVHYSSDFAARGYAGASHGCVNVRDHDGIEQLFDEVHLGDKVVVYWS